MKKKALTVILPLCVAMVISACGGNTDTTEVEETTATTESTEADAQTEVETEEQEEAVESEQTENEASADEESSEEIESGDDGAVNGDEFPAIGEYLYLVENDKSDEYGVYSISCFDLDEYLDEDGILPGIDDYENTDWNDWTNRWAYPKFTPCRFFDGLTLIARSDKVEGLSANDSDTGDSITINVFSGLYQYNYEYNWWKEQADDPDFDFEEYKFNGFSYYMFTAQTTEGETEVLVRTDRYSYGGDDVWYNCKWYYFNIGNFSVSVQCNEYEESEDPIELSEDDLQLIIDNIHLTDGAEH